jgi:hypothetical protein
MRVFAAGGRHWWRAASGASKAAVLCGSCSALAGVLVFVVGWALDVTVVRALVPGPISMKASTAGMFVLAGAGGGAARG